MLHDTQTLIQIAKVVQYLSIQNIESRTALDGGRIDKRHPRLLYLARTSLEAQFNDNSNSSYIPLLNSYVYALCAPFFFEAQLIVNQSGGGTVIVPSTGLSDVTYSDSETFII